MSVLQHNSQEYIKSQIIYAQDGSFARLHSVDICDHLKQGVDRDEAFNEAIEYASTFLDKTFNHTETIDNGSNCTQEWTNKN